MGWLDNALDKVKDAGSKAKNTVTKSANILTIPVGATLDLVRWAPGVDDNLGPDFLSAKSAFSDATDLLMGENTLTGWSVSEVGKGLNWVYQNAVENPLEAGWYSDMAVVPQLVHWNDDPVSWSEGWDMAKKRSLGQTTELALNETLNRTSEKTGNWDTSAAVRGIPLVGSYLEEAGIGADETKNVASRDADAWEEFHSKSPFWSGATASGIDIGSQFVADPFLAATKLTAAQRALRTARPIQEGEEVGLADKMATEKTHKVLGLPSRKAGLKSRTDPLIGTVKYEDKLADGKTVVDADGTKQLVPVQDMKGWLDDKSPVQVYTGLGLKAHPYGDQIATLLSRTNEIEDVASKVNIRRDILASIGGDAAANRRLATAAETKEFAYTLSNAYQGRGTGELAMALADESNAAAIATKTAPPSFADPSVVAGVTDELKAQHGFNEWLYASMKDRTLVASPKGNRALARLSGQGVGRDGSLHTGYTGFDDIVNNKILGKFKSDGSKVDDALASSDELAAGKPVRDAKVYQADQESWSRGPNSQPATLVRGGIKLAGWASGITPAAKAATKVSDALRGRVVQGSLNVEDAQLSVAVTQDFLRRAGIESSEIDHLVSEVVNASGPTARSVAVQRAQDHAINTVAQRYGVDLDLIARIHAEHGARMDAVMTAKRGQSYSAHTKLDADGKVIRGDVVYLPDGQGTIVLPILDSQTINNMPLIDLDYVEKWLKRDKYISAVGNQLRKVGSNPQAKRATELGFNSRVTAQLEKQSDKWVRFIAEETNSWWKRSVLLSRAPSYAFRNTSEEVMRVASISHTAVVADAAARHAAHRARDFARRRGNPRYQDMAPDYARLELRKSELEDLRDLHDDPEIFENVQAVRKELRSMQAKQRKAWSDGDTAKADELRNAIEWTESLPQITEHGAWFDEISSLEREIAGLTKSLDEKILPDSDIRTLVGFGDAKFPDAFHGVGGRQAYDLVGNGGSFDEDVTQFGERTFARRRGAGQQDSIDVRSPYTSDDKVAQHLVAWEHILNRQIRNDPAARVAVQAIAERADDVESRVFDYLDSPAAAKYRSNNPHRAHDTEDWAFEISEMVKHNVHDDGIAQRLLDGEVSRAELKELLPQELRPPVHPAGVDDLVGFGNRKLANFAGRTFKRIDNMSVNAITRHPLFSVFFREEQERLAHDFLRKAHFEGGEDAFITPRDIDNLTERARKTARAKVRQTFYDTSSRSSAAQKLRFVYPFFAAHQDSMTFWGKAIAQNPNVLREFQLAFQVPASLGLVVDREGNPVKPGEFVQNDHVVLLQVPKAWGGPDPKDPTAKGAGFRIQLNAANLITQNGSIINPGAGPMAAIPAGYIQRKYGATNDDLSKAMTWFNPYGAPKEGGNNALPGSLQFLDPAVPTSIKRFATLYDTFTTKNSREYTEMFALRFTEAQVKFYEENDRPPNSQEARELEDKTADEVKHMSLLRFGASVFSPVQPQPASRHQGFVNEFRQLQEQGRNEGRGPFWATDTFLNRYGDEYIALTKSSSENRAKLDPSSAAVRSLKAHSNLTDKTVPETWRLIVGGEGEGAFSMDAYRWMQNKAVSSSGSGEKLIDKKAQMERLLDVNVAAGWRAYNKAMNSLQAVATENGFTSVEQSPQLKVLKQQINAELGEKFPDWAANKQGDTDFNAELWPSIQTIASNKQLLNDPAREDIRTLAQYVQGRQGVLELLKQRKAAGGSLEIDANSNADIAYTYALFISQLTEGNTNFSDYAVPGIISRDPLYNADILEVAGGK